MRAASPGGFRKISIAELRPGMTVVDTGLPAANNPGLFSHAGLIGSKRDIAGLEGQGYREVFVQDPTEDHGPKVGEGQGRGEQSPAADRPAKSHPDLYEYARAQALYETSLELVKGIIGDARAGRPLNRNDAELLTSRISEQVRENPDALVSLITLREYHAYPYTHSINVSVLSVVFGRHLGLKDLALQELGMAGLLHDLGKTKVPDSILNKPAPLTTEELQVIRSHPHDGAQMLKRQGGFSAKTIKAVLGHHEKFNGQGYPFGISGDKLGLAAQIVGLADVYDALTSHRAYRIALLPNTAMRILLAMRGHDFSPVLVERFVACLGVYPVGSMVRLDSGEAALVCGSNAANPLRPTVKIIMDRHLHHRPSRILDLSLPRTNATGEAARIVGPMDPIALGIDSLGLLF